MTIASSFICTLKEYGHIFCIDYYSDLNLNIRIPNDLTRNIKQISGMKSLYAVKIAEN